MTFITGRSANRSLLRPGRRFPGVLNGATCGWTSPGEPPGQACRVERWRRDRLTGRASDFPETDAVVPVRGRRGDVVRRAPHEVPPHQHGLAERLPPPQEETPVPPGGPGDTAAAGALG